MLGFPGGANAFDRRGSSRRNVAAGGFIPGTMNRVAGRTVVSRMKPDTNAEIDAELNAARAKYGSTDFELLCLEGSRGDTIDDEQLLKMLRRFNQTGSANGRIAVPAQLPSLWRRITIRLRGAVLPWLVER